MLTWVVRDLSTLLLTCCMLAPGGCDSSAIGPDGELKPLATFGGLGDVPGRFAYPRTVESGADVLWVIDKSARIQAIDPETGQCRATWRMPEFDLGKPTGLCVAPGVGADGTWKRELLYIPDTHYHRVMIVEPPALPATGRADGGEKIVATFGSAGTGPGEFYYPTDVFVLLNADQTKVERIYVSEYGGNDRVSVFDPSFKFLFSFGVFEPASDDKKIQFHRPQSMTMWTRSDGTRELLVSDSGHHRIGRFTLDGALIGWIGSPDKFGRGLGDLNSPYGIQVLDDSTALVAEWGNNRVQRIDLATGKGLEIYGSPGSEDGQMLAPWAVVARGKKAFALDSGNNRIIAFRSPSAAAGMGTK
jgi:hypothetical protein